MLCQECSAKFRPSRAWQKYCSVHCKRERQRKQTEKLGLLGPDKFPIPTCTVGAIAELRVAVDLLTRGYDVFRAISQSCSCNLAILKNGRLLRIEARTGYKYGGKLKYFKKKDLGKQDHFAICLPDQIIYEPPLPE